MGIVVASTLTLFESGALMFFFENFAALLHGAMEKLQNFKHPWFQMSSIVLGMVPEHHPFLGF